MSLTPCLRRSGRTRSVPKHLSGGDMVWNVKGSLTISQISVRKPKKGEAHLKAAYFETPRKVKAVNPKRAVAAKKSEGPSKAGLKPPTKGRALSTGVGGRKPQGMTGLTGGVPGSNLQKAAHEASSTSPTSLLARKIDDLGKNMPKIISRTIDQKLGSDMRAFKKSFATNETSLKTMDLKLNNISVMNNKKFAEFDAHKVETAVKFKKLDGKIEKMHEEMKKRLATNNAQLMKVVLKTAREEAKQKP